jgi:molybdopterin biosynthesis enzyme MoaB
MYVIASITEKQNMFCLEGSSEAVKQSHEETSMKQITSSFGPHFMQ